MRTRIIKLIILFLMLMCLNAQAQTDVKSVVVTTPEVATNTNLLSLTGSFSPIQHSILSPREDGLINELLVDAGDLVKKGDKLMQLDPIKARLLVAEQKALLEQIKIQQKESQRLVNEAERLLKQRHISATELAKRKAVLAQNNAEKNAIQASLSSAQETVSRHTLFAPFDGVISTKHVEVGEWVSRGDAVLTLTNLDNLFLDVMVPQEHFIKIGLETPVTIRPDANPTVKINGRIDKIVPISNRQSRALLVRINVDATKHKLLPGTTAQVEIQLAEKATPSLLIPRDALLIHPDGGYSVFVIDTDNTAKRRIVSIEENRQQGTLVSKGLTINDTIVIRGNEVLNDGDKVDIQD